MSRGLQVEDGETRGVLLLLPPPMMPNVPLLLLLLLLLLVCISLCTSACSSCCCRCLSIISFSAVAACTDMSAAKWNGRSVALLHLTLQLVHARASRSVVLQLQRLLLKNSLLLLLQMLQLLLQFF